MDAFPADWNIYVYIYVHLNEHAEKLHDQMHISEQLNLHAY